MELKLTNKDKFRLGIIALLVMLITIIGWLFIGAIIHGIIIILGLLIILTLQLHTHREEMSVQKVNLRKLVAQEKNNYMQLEALSSLYFSLNNKIPPLPNARGWAASPDFLKTIATLIYENKPSLVVEAGSGISTIVSGYCLSNVNSGKIISLDHKKEFAQKTQKYINTHDLIGICNVIHAPIKNYLINEKYWKWYEISNLNLTNKEKIDLLIIDGPPGDLQKESRYPALPLLIDYLGEDSVILMDDGNRNDEKAIVDRWTSEFSSLKAEYIPLEKGGYILQVQ